MQAVTERVRNYTLLHRNFAASIKQWPSVLCEPIMDWLIFPPLVSAAAPLKIVISPAGKSLCLPRNIKTHHSEVDIRYYTYSWLGLWVDQAVRHSGASRDVVAVVALRARRRKVEGREGNDLLWFLCAVAETFNYVHFPSQWFFFSVLAGSLAPTCVQF